MPIGNLRRIQYWLLGIWGASAVAFLIVAKAGRDHALPSAVAIPALLAIAFVFGVSAFGVRFIGNIRMLPESRAENYRVRGATLLLGAALVLTSTVGVIVLAVVVAANH